MKSDTPWTGGCLCGLRRYEFRGDPPHSGYCHCDICKRVTGGAFAVLVQAPRDALKWTKEPPAVYRSSPIATRGFCPACGSPLFLQYDDHDCCCFPLAAGRSNRSGAVACVNHPTTRVVMFRFIHSSDLHLGKRFGNFAGDLPGRLLEARHDVIARLAQHARRQNATTV